MQSGLLLLIDADRRVQRGVTRTANEAGMEVVCCDTAKAGVNTCCAIEPAVVVTELELPDQDGYWVITNIREQAGDIAVTPIVVATHEIDTSSRARTLNAGADVFMQKPIAALDLVAQVRALAKMTDRVRERPTVTPGMLLQMPAPAPAPPSTALPAAGTFERHPPVTILIALEIERRSGRLVMRPRGDGVAPLEIELASGIIVEGRLAGRTLDPIAVVRAVLTFTEGDFELVPGLELPPPPLMDPTGRLLSVAAQEPAPRSRRGAPRAATVPPIDSDQRPTMKPPRGGPSKPPPAKATLRASGRPTKPPRNATARPPPVKVPPARVPVFAPAPAKAAPDKPVADKPAVDKPVADKPVADKPMVPPPPVPRPGARPLPRPGVAARPAPPIAPPAPPLPREALPSQPEDARASITGETRASEPTDVRRMIPRPAPPPPRPPPPPRLARQTPPPDDEDIIEAENDA